MQPLEKSLYQPWLAAGANGKIAPVRTFFQAICASPMVSLFHQLSYPFYILHRLHRKRLAVII